MSNVSTPTSTTADDKAKRVRDLLSSYYGNQPASGSGTGTPEAVTPSRSKGFGGSRGSGLDSAAFDADRYLSQLLRGTRLDGLLSKHVEMSTEIKVLDSDMQMLVYENYNKFISATDTIRSMKSNVDGMDTNMHELKTVIGWLCLRVEISVTGFCNTMQRNDLPTMHSWCLQMVWQRAAMLSTPNCN